MKVKSILLPTLVLFLVCTVVTAALSLTNSITKDTIAKAQQQALQESMEQLVPGAEYTSLNQQNTQYTAQKGDVLYYIFITEATGYKSKVQVMTAVDEAGKIVGVTVTGCADESPGIGQKVGTDTGFIAQFTGREEPSDSVDAITGATISSKAVNTAVNEALEQYQALTKGGAAQ